MNKINTITLIILYLLLFTFNKKNFIICITIAKYDIINSTIKFNSMNPSKIFIQLKSKYKRI